MHKIREYKYQLNLELLSYQLDAERFQLHLDQATALRNQLVNDLLPWIDIGPTDLKQIAESMRQQYIETFGDPADPAFQKEIERTCAFLRRGE